MEAGRFSEVFVPLTRRPLVVTAVNVSYLIVFVVVPRNFGFPIAGHREAFGRVMCMRGSVHLGRFVKADHVRCICVRHGWVRRLPYEGANY